MWTVFDTETIQKHSNSCSLKTTSFEMIILVIILEEFVMINKRSDMFNLNRLQITTHDIYEDSTCHLNDEKPEFCVTSYITI